MSELSEILSLAQLDKHYKLIDYLSKHPNEEFTIAQLDYFLSQGASIQRFPPEWLAYMEDGKCSNRNVEVYRKETERKAKADTSGDSRDSASASAVAYREHQRQVVLLCRRPEVTTLAQLQQLIKKPSASVDAEDCVALHTDQVILSPELIQQAQRSGIAYYFPDRLSRWSDARAVNEEKSRGPGIALETGEGVAEAAAATADRVQYLALPPGVYLESKHRTHRGTSVREECGLPTTMEVGEELYLTLDDSNARRLQLQRDRAVVLPPLTVQFELAGMAKEAPRPLEIRVEKSNYSVQREDNSGTFRAFKVFMMLKAMHRGRCKLVLNVNGDEHIVNMVVDDTECEMPGVLVGCEREPEDVHLDPKLFFPDFLLAPPSVLSTSYLAQLCSEEQHVDDDRDKAEATLSSPPPPSPPLSTSGSNTTTDVNALFNAMSCVPLPWWLNASPTAGALREVTYPPAESIAATQGAMLAARSLKDSHRLAEARLRVSMEEEKRAKGAKRTRNFSIGATWAVNRHMIHFGLDTLVPFKKPEANEE